MLKVADAVDAHAEALAQLLSREQGKPLNGPNARFEVGGASAWLRVAASTPLETEILIEGENGRLPPHWGLWRHQSLELAHDDCYVADFPCYSHGQRRRC